MSPPDPRHCSCPFCQSRRDRANHEDAFHPSIEAQLLADRGGNLVTDEPEYVTVSGDLVHDHEVQPVGGCGCAFCSQ